ncbi:MAG TPA: hypothetical protein VIR81_10280 [Myxococcales bacterium]|nr:hypothetical protein [Myxococcales bacterium]
MEWFEQATEKARDRARFRVAALRLSHPGEDQVALGRRLVASSALRGGLAGAATGSLALFALPLGLPAGMAVSLFVEAELIFALLELYELDTSGEAGRLKLYTLWAGAGFAGAARSAGLRTGARAVGRVLEGSVPVRIIRRLNPALLKAILRRLGLGWLPRTAKLWPLLGAPVSFVLDRAALRALGNATLATLDDEARERRRRAPPAKPRYRRVKVTAG